MIEFEWKEPKPIHPVRVSTDTEAKPLLRELGIVIQDSLLSESLFKGQGSRQIRVTR